MRVLLLFMCWVFLFPFNSFTQNQNSKGRWAITFTPALIPVPSGGQFGIQPGVEYSFDNRWSFLTEVTFQTGKKQHSDSVALNKKYLRIKPELRYHFLSKSNKLTKYIGLQASYTFRSFRNEKDGFYFDNLPWDSVYYFDKAHIYSPITTVSVQFGIILSDGKRFGADLFAGTGLRFVNTSFTEVQNLRQDLRMGSPDLFSTTASYQRKGWLTELHLNAGVRFMFRFGKIDGKGKDRNGN